MNKGNRRALRVFRAAAVVLSLGLALAWGGTAQAEPQYSMSCIACHQMPPLDSGTAKKNPYTGAVPGNHQGHAATSAASCVVCHGAGVTGYGNSHRNKVIELSDSLGYSRKAVGAFLNQTSVPPSPLGSCSAVACHSDGKGTLKATPAWGSAAFSAPADCGQCHGSAPATGNHPVTGSKHAAYFGTGTGSCAKCHADHTVEAKPFGHATSAGHRAIQVKFNGTGSFAGTSCSTVYCHSNGKGSYATATWGATLDCAGCHGSATAAGPAALSAKHALHVNNATVLGSNYGCVECHSATVSSNTAIADVTKHADGTIELAGARVGTVSAGSCATSYCHSDGKGTQKSVTWTQTQTLDCKGCHGSDAAPAFTSVAGEPNYANLGAGVARANSHKNHVSAAGDCQNCHATTTVDGLSIKSGSAAHTNSVIDVVAGNGKSFTVAGKTCSNVSCHSGNGIIANVAPATWGASLGCAGCHGDATTLASNAHAKHVSGKGYACSTCHASTVTGSTTIANPALHGDGSVEVAGSFIYTAAAKTCSTAACHGSSTPSWTNTATGSCGSCHAALSTTTGGVIATNGHGAHFSAAYGPALAGNTAASCAVCHVYTTDTAATHVDGTVQLAAGYNKVGTCTGCHQQTTNWTTGRVSCESCHSTAGGPLSVIGGVTAPDKTLAASAGHGRAGIGQACSACHDSGAGHISGVLGDNNRLLPALTGAANQECNYCHNDSGKVTPAHLNMQVHVGSGATCAACHDAHGTTNSNMVAGSIGGSAVSFSGTNFVNAQGTGVCQTCHTATAYYKKGVAETNHPATNCLDCHAHNAVSGTAFEPNRACDSCHGYPPAPRKTLAGVTFGVQNNWSSARFEDYSGGGGAHVVAGHIPKGAKASDGWVNCIPCHAGGAASHAKLLPARSHVENVSVQLDQKLRFSNDVMASYTTAKLVSGGANKTGSCFNVSCHFAPTPKWSTER